MKKADSIVSKNKINPIVFCTPEIGRWSTLGGVGYTIDELTQGLVKLEQNIYVISPYYEKNS